MATTPGTSADLNIVIHNTNPSSVNPSNVGAINRELLATFKGIASEFRALTKTLKDDDSRSGSSKEGGNASTLRGVIKELVDANVKQNRPADAPKNAPRVIDPDIAALANAAEKLINAVDVINTSTRNASLVRPEERVRRTKEALSAYQEFSGQLKSIPDARLMNLSPNASLLKTQLANPATNVAQSGVYRIMQKFMEDRKGDIAELEKAGFAFTLNEQGLFAQGQKRAGGKPETYTLGTITTFDRDIDSAHAIKVRDSLERSLEQMEKNVERKFSAGSAPRNPRDISDRDISAAGIVSEDKAGRKTTEIISRAVAKSSEDLVKVAEAMKNGEMGREQLVSALENLVYALKQGSSKALTNIGVKSASGAIGTSFDPRNLGLLLGGEVPQAPFAQTVYQSLLRSKPNEKTAHLYSGNKLDDEKFLAAYNAGDPEIMSRISKAQETKRKELLSNLSKSDMASLRVVSSPEDNEMVDILAKRIFGKEGFGNIAKQVSTAGGGRSEADIINEFRARPDLDPVSKEVGSKLLENAFARIEKKRLGVREEDEILTKGQLKELGLAKNSDPGATITGGAISEREFANDILSGLRTVGGRLSPFVQSGITNVPGLNVKAFQEKNEERSVLGIDDKAFLSLGQDIAQSRFNTAPSLTSVLTAAGVEIPSASVPRPRPQLVKQASAVNIVPQDNQLGPGVQVVPIAGGSGTGTDVVSQGVVPPTPRPLGPPRQGLSSGLTNKLAEQNAAIAAKAAAEAAAAATKGTILGATEGLSAGLPGKEPPSSQGLGEGLGKGLGEGLGKGLGPAQPPPASSPQGATSTHSMNVETNIQNSRPGGMSQGELQNMIRTIMAEMNASLKATLTQVVQAGAKPSAGGSGGGGGTTPPPRVASGSPDDGRMLGVLSGINGKLLAIREELKFQPELLRTINATLLNMHASMKAGFASVNTVNQAQTPPSADKPNGLNVQQLQLLNSNLAELAKVLAALKADRAKPVDPQPNVVPPKQSVQTQAQSTSSNDVLIKNAFDQLKASNMKLSVSIDNLVKTLAAGVVAKAAKNVVRDTPPGGGGGGGGKKRKGKPQPGDEDYEIKFEYDIRNNPLRPRQITQIERAGGVKPVRVGDDLDALLGTRLFGSEFKRGKFLGSTVSVDNVIRDLFENIQKDLRQVPGARLSQIKDLKGLGFNDKQIRELDTRFSKDQPVSLGLKAQFKVIEEIKLQLEEFRVGLRKTVQEMRGGTGGGTINPSASRELIDKQSLIYATRDPDSGTTLAKYAINTDQYGKTVVKSLTAASDAVNVHVRQVNSAIRRLTIWGSASFAIFGLVNQLQNLVKVTIDFDSRMRTMGFLMNRTTTDFGKLGQEAFRVAKAFGFSVNETLDAMVVFAQQGRTQAEVIDLVTSSLLAANQTELTATAATEALTAAMAIFNIQASDSQRIIDAWANVANKSAASADVLATAIKKIGSTASLVGVDFNELNAIVATVQIATRKSGSEIGTGLKFIFQSFQKPEVIELLESLGVAVFKSQGEMRGLVDILRDVQERFGSLTDVQQIQVLTTIASRRHFADLAVILRDLDGLQKRTKDSANSFGVAQRNNAIVMQGFGKQLDVMKTSLSEAGVSFANSGFIQGLVTAAKGVSVLAGAFDSIPGVVVSGITVLALMTAGLHGVSRLLVSLGGQELPDFKLGLNAAAAAEKLLASQTNKATLELLTQGNVLDNLNTKLQSLGGGKFAAATNNPAFASAVRSSGLVKLAERAKSGNLDSTITSAQAFENANPFILEQKRQRFSIVGSTVGFAASAAALAAARRIRDTNENGNFNRELAATGFEGLSKVSGGASLGLAFGGPKGAAIGAGVGAILGTVDVVNRLGEGFEAQLQRSDRFTASIREQIDALDQLKTEIIDLDKATKDSLTGTIVQQEFPGNKTIDAFTKFAAAMKQLGTLESGGEFNAKAELDKIFGQSDNTGAFPLNDLTRGMNDSSEAASRLASISSDLAQSFDKITKLNNIAYFSSLRKEMSSLSAETAEYQRTIQAEGGLFGQVASIVTSGKIGSLAFGNSGFSSIEKFKGNLVSAAGFDQTGNILGARARALEERNIFDVATGVGQGYSNVNVAQAAAFQDGVTRYTTLLKSATDRLRATFSDDASTNVGNAQEVFKLGIGGLGGFVNKPELTIADLPEEISRLEKSGDKNTALLLKGFATYLSNVQQTAASRNISSTAGSISEQRAFNIQEGYRSFGGNVLDIDRMEKEIAAGTQIIAQRGDEFRSVIIDKISPQGIATLISTSQTNGISTEFAKVFEAPLASVKNLITKELGSFDQVDFFKVGVNQTEAFKSNVEDVQKGMRRILTNSDRILATFNKNMAELNHNLERTRSITRDTFADGANLFREFSAFNAVASEAAGQIFGKRQIGFSPLDTRNLPKEVTNAGFVQKIVTEDSFKQLNLDRQIVDSQRDLVVSLDTLTKAIAKNTTEGIYGQFTNPTSLIKNSFETLQTDRSIESLGNFIKTAGPLSLDADRLKRDFNNNPDDVISYLGRQVNRTLSFDQLASQGKLPGSFRSINSGLSNALADDTIGMIDLAKSFEAAQLILFDVVQSARRQKQAQDIEVNRTVTQDGKLTTAQLGTLEERAALAEAGVENLDNLGDPEKVQAAFNELIQKLATVRSAIAENARLIEDTFANRLTLGLRAFTSSVSDLEKANIFGSIAASVQDLIKIGSGESAFDRIGSVLNNTRDQFGRRAELSTTDIESLSAAITQGTRFSPEQGRSAIQAGSDRARLFGTATSLGSLSSDLTDTLTKQSVFGDINLAAESVSKFRREIEKLIEEGHKPEEKELKELIKLYRELEGARAAQERFFDDRNTRALKAFTERQIAGGIAGAGLSDQQRGIIKSDPRLFQQALQAGIIPGASNEGGANIRAALDGMLSGIDALRTSLAGQLKPFSQELQTSSVMNISTAGTVQLNAASVVINGGASADPTANFPIRHSGGIQADETLARVQKGEAIIPRSLVGLLPREILMQLGTDKSGMKSVMGLPTYHNGLKPENFDRARALIETANRVRPDGTIEGLSSKVAKQVAKMKANSPFARAQAMLDSKEINDLVQFLHPDYNLAGAGREALVFGNTRKIAKFVPKDAAHFEPNIIDFAINDGIFTPTKVHDVGNYIVMEQEKLGSSLGASPEEMAAFKSRIQAAGYKYYDFSPQNIGRGSDGQLYIHDPGGLQVDFGALPAKPRGKKQQTPIHISEAFDQDVIDTLKARRGRIEAGTAIGEVFAPTGSSIAETLVYGELNSRGIAYRAGEKINLSTMMHESLHVVSNLTRNPYTNFAGVGKQIGLDNIKSFMKAIGVPVQQYETLIEKRINNLAREIPNLNKGDATISAFMEEAMATRAEWGNLPADRVLPSRQLQKLTPIYDALRNIQLDIGLSDAVLAQADRYFAKSDNARILARYGINTQEASADVAAKQPTSKRKATKRFRDPVTGKFVKPTPAQLARAAMDVARDARQIPIARPAAPPVVSAAPPAIPEHIRQAASARAIMNKAAENRRITQSLDFPHREIVNTYGHDFLFDATPGKTLPRNFGRLNLSAGFNLAQNVVSPTLIDYAAGDRGTTGKDVAADLAIGSGILAGASAGIAGLNKLSARGAGIGGQFLGGAGLYFGLAGAAEQYSAAGESTTKRGLFTHLGGALALTGGAIQGGLVLAEGTAAGVIAAPAVAITAGTIGVIESIKAQNISKANLGIQESLNERYDAASKILTTALNNSKASVETKNQVRKQFQSIWRNNGVQAPKLSGDLIRSIPGLPEEIVRVQQNRGPDPITAYFEQQIADMAKQKETIANTLQEIDPVRASRILDTEGNSIANARILALKREADLAYESRSRDFASLSIGREYASLAVGDEAKQREQFFREVAAVQKLLPGVDKYTIADTLKRVKMRKFHDGGISSEEQVAILKEGEMVVPSSLVGAIPQGIMNRIPGANIDARITSPRKPNEVSSTQNIEVTVPTNVQIIVPNMESGTISPDAIRELLKKELGGQNLLRHILDAPIQVL